MLKIKFDTYVPHPDYMKQGNGPSINIDYAQCDPMSGRSLKTPRFNATQDYLRTARDEVFGPVVQPLAGQTYEFLFCVDNTKTKPAFTEDEYQQAKQRSQQIASSYLPVRYIDRKLIDRLIQRDNVKSEKARDVQHKFDALSKNLTDQFIQLGLKPSQVKVLQAAHFGSDLRLHAYEYGPQEQISISGQMRLRLDQNTTPERVKELISAANKFYATHIALQEIKKADAKQDMGVENVDCEDPSWERDQDPDNFTIPVPV